MLYNEEIRNLKNKSGVYLLYNDEENLVYVGKSIDIGSRIVSSSAHRRITNFKYILISNMSDMCLVEISYIMKFKPIYNTEFKYDDEATIELLLPYDTSKMYSFIRIEEESDVYDDALINDICDGIEVTVGEQSVDVSCLIEFHIREYLKKHF